MLLSYMHRKPLDRRFSRRDVDKHISGRSGQINWSIDPYWERGWYIAMVELEV